MNDWNFDMSAAPRGVEHREQRKFGNEVREVTRVEVEWIWAALANGQVYRTHWIEPTRWHPNGRWTGLHSETVPIAWMRYETPMHPAAAELAAAAEAHSQRDADLALVLVRKSTNAHGFINFSILSERVDSLSPPARKELSETLTQLGEKFRDAPAP